MKKLIQILIPVILLFITGCTKESAPGGRSTNKSSLSFKYNGKPYTLTYTNEGVQDWSAGETRISIKRPDIFGGFISFLKPGCAYMEPYEGNVDVTGNCEISNYPGSTPLDYTAVYIYQSGSYNFSYSNCETKELYDPVTGNNYTRHICDGSGTFSLVLKNNGDKLIAITDGVIKIFNESR